MEARHVLIGGLALTALVVGVGIYRASNTGAKLELDMEPRLRRLDFAGLQVELDAAYKNPTRGAVTLRNPVVRLTLEDGTQLMHLDMAGREIDIQPLSEGKLSDPAQLGGKIVLRVPYEVILRLAPQAVQAILGATPPLRLLVRTTATVTAPNLPPLPYADTTPILIQSLIG
jgi:hypothetical protein